MAVKYWLRLSIEQYDKDAEESETLRTADLGIPTTSIDNIDKKFVEFLEEIKAKHPGIKVDLG